MDVDKYLERIGINEKLEPNLQTLKNLQKAHLYNIPFENLDIHSSNKIILDPESLYSKIVLGNRGGFCYELNGLFYELLISLGFNAKRISARVYNKANGYGKEFDHMALIVTIENREYLVDVGFGDFCYEPIKLELNRLHKDQAGKFYFDMYKEKKYRISKVQDGEMVPQYIFNLTNRTLEEFREMCEYHQSNPESHFTHQKIITLAKQNGRATLSESKLKITKNNISKETPIKKNEFSKYLSKYFGMEGK